MSKVLKLTEQQKQFLKRNNLTLKQVSKFFGIVDINKSRAAKHKYINALMAFESHIKQMEIKKNEVSDCYRAFGQLDHRVKLFAESLKDM